MFIGRAYRKKRKVPLPGLRAAPKKRPRMSWSRPAHDARGIERNWYECTYRSHAACCGCGNFIHHINTLATRYGFAPGAPPPGGPRPRPPVPVDTPRPALPWRGGGEPGGDGANPEGDGDGGADAGDYRAEELEELFAAVEGDQ